MMYLDLDELPRLFDGVPLWSHERTNLASWRRRNYLGPRGMPLADAVRYRVKHHTGVVVDGPIRMLCHMGYFGYCYNPVVFYYCYDREDTKVEAIVAEITNTPWGERHAYVLPESMNLGSGAHKRHRFPKAFHVSPFMPMNIEYDWRFTEPGEDLNVHMEDHDAEGKLFDATLTLKRNEITSINLARALLSYPLMTWRVMALIHWQALRLWMKRVPFIEHPQPRPKDNKDPDGT
jgi:DUF1365 family protein